MEALSAISVELSRTLTFRKPALWMKLVRVLPVALTAIDDAVWDSKYGLRGGGTPKLASPMLDQSCRDVDAT